MKGNKYCAGDEMIKSKYIEKVYKFVNDISGVRITNAFSLNEGFEEDYEIIYGESENGKFRLWYEGQYVFEVEYPDGQSTHWHPFEAENAAIEIEKFIDENYRPINNLYCVYYNDAFIFPHNESYHRPNEDSDVFIIAEKEAPKGETDSFSWKRISEGCKNFVCFGKYAKESEFALDMACIKQNGDEKDVVLTATEDDFDAFVDEIYEAAKYSDDNVFLFYDDGEIYSKIKKTLIKMKKAKKS